MPFLSFWGILIWSFRLSQMLRRNWYQEKAFIFEWKNLIITMKCISNGIIDAVWYCLPISVSKFLAFVLSFDMMFLIVFVQAMNLGSSKLTHNVSVLYTHPKTTLISYNAPSDFSFDVSIILSLDGGYFWPNGRETAWITSGIAVFPLYLLLPISGMTFMQSSRYMSIFAWGSTGILTAKALLSANDMEMSLVDGGGIKSWFGVWVSCASQVLSKSRAFLRSVNGLEIVLHLAGLFAPPKVSLSDMRTYNVPLHLVWVANWIADCADNCCRRQALLKSSFMVSILLVGWFDRILTMLWSNCLWMCP